MRRRITPTQQLTAAECGLCCCSMVLRYFGSHEPMWHLRADVEVGRDGMTASGVRDVLRSRGVDARVYRAGTAALERVALPAVLFWEDCHFVVLETIDRRRATIVDPAVGRRVIDRDELDSSFSGVVVAGTPGEDFDPRRNAQPSPWRDFLAPIRRRPSRLLPLLGLSVLVYLATLGVPLLNEQLVDSYVAGVGPSQAPRILLLAAAVLVGFGLVMAVQAATTARLVLEVGRELMERTYGHLLRLPFAYFGNRTTGELMFRLASVSAVRDLVSTQLVAGVLDVGILVVVLAVLWSRAPVLGLAVLVIFALIVTVLLLTRQRVADALDREMTATSRSQAMQLESIVSIESVKVAGIEQRLMDRWRTVYARSLETARARTVLQGRIDAVVSALRTAGPVVVLVVALSMVESGGMTLGGAVAVQSLSTVLFGVAANMFASYTQFLVAGSLLGRLSDVVHVAPRDVVGGTLDRPIGGRLEVRDVSFAYPGATVPVLSGVSFSCEAGQKVAVVGASGSGKSTLGRLLVGLYAPTSGAVLVDGHDLGEFDKRSFFRQVGHVPQDVTLVNGTVRDNVTLGLDDVDPAVYAAALDGARLVGDLASMPMGDLTLVSESGQNVSGGQRQRIAIARALVKEPRILVLDEATSSLDLANEAMVAAHLRELRCTRVVIAHRLSTVVDADQILVVEAGRVVESGTHGQLMARGGRYVELFRTQLEEMAAMP